MSGRLPAKILIVKPSSLGDVVQAMPVLRTLKARLPQSRIYWWVDEKLAGLLEGDPDLEGVLLFRRSNWASPVELRHLLGDIIWMRKQQFDWVLDLQSLARSSFISWLVNGKFTVGLDDRREGAPAFYDLAVPRRSEHEHAVDWYKHVVEALGMDIAPFEWLPQRTAAAHKVRPQWSIDQHRWVVFQPGARWSNKRWPAENFAQVAQLLASWDPALRFAVLGSGEDKPLGKVICDAVPECLDLTGALSLPEMIEWLRASACLVSNDTGPMHVAAALGKPVTAIFGPTDPARTGPYGQVGNVLQGRVACVPCMKKTCANRMEPLACMNAITPAMVAQLVRRNLARS